MTTREEAVKALAEAIMAAESDDDVPWSERPRPGQVLDNLESLGWRLQVEPPDPLATYVPSRDEAGYLVSKAQRAESEAIAALRDNIDNLPARTRAGWERWVQPDTKTYLLAEAVYAAIDAALGAKAERPRYGIHGVIKASHMEGEVRVIDEVAIRGVSVVSDALARAYAAGYRDGLANEVDDWNAPDEVIDEYGRQYVAAMRETGR